MKRRRTLTRTRPRALAQRCAAVAHLWPTDAHADALHFSRPTTTSSARTSFSFSPSSSGRATWRPPSTSAFLGLLCDSVQKLMSTSFCLSRAGISLTLARRFLRPSEALRQTQTALAELRLAMSLDKTAHSRNLQIACQVQLASLTMLLAKLSEGLHLSMVPRAIWQGEVGNLAREAVRLCQEVVRAEDAVIHDGYVPETPGFEGSAESWDEDESEDLVNTRLTERERRGSSICHRRVTEETLVEAYLALGEAAQLAAVLAPDLINSDKYFDIAEGALEGAYRTARDLRSSSLGPLPTTRMST